MVGRNRPWQSGQALVQVAILMVALLAFAAFAIDFGRIYLERRLLQNAADAGALAGARFLCFGNGAYNSVDEAARAFALGNIPNPTDPQRNTQVVVELPGDDLVRVTAYESAVPTSLARIVKLDTVRVGATAVAKCGKATGAGGLWPLSVKIQDYDTINCGDKFYVFTDDNTGKGVDCSQCICDLPIPGGSGTMRRIGPGERGYLRFFVPPDPLPRPCGDTENCGASELGCWFRSSHPGPVSVCDIIPGKPGVDDSVQNDVNSRAGDLVNIVLWDDELACPPRDPLGTCPGDPYRVAGFGCITVGIGDAKTPWRTVDFQPKDPKYKKCPKNVKVIVATKQCPCDSYTGNTGGETCDQPHVCSVSLVE